MDEIYSLKKNINLKLLKMLHALGASIKIVLLAIVNIVICVFSFHPVKSITTGEVELLQLM